MTAVRPIVALATLVAVVALVGVALVGARAEAGRKRRAPVRRPVAGFPDRPVDLYLPDRVPEGGSPLLVVMHGGGGDSVAMARLTSPDGELDNPEALHALANRQGAIVAYVNGTRRSLGGPVRNADARDWASGNLTAPTLVGQRLGVDDDAYLARVIRDVRRRHPVDPTRVAVGGMSNGGQMAYHAGHRVPGVAAVFVVGGGDELARFGAVPPDGVALLHLHGTRDLEVPFARHGRSRGLTPANAYAGALPSVAAWVRAHGALQIGWPEAGAGRAPDGMRTILRRFASRRGDVWLATSRGAGHTWPGGFQYLPPSLVGHTARDVSANRLILDFVAANPRR